MTVEERLDELEARIRDLEEVAVWISSLSQRYAFYQEPQGIVHAVATQLAAERGE